MWIPTLCLVYVKIIITFSYYYLKRKILIEFEAPEGSFIVEPQRKTQSSEKLLGNWNLMVSSTALLSYNEHTIHCNS